MIDVESQVFQRCATAFRAAYPNGFIAPEYVAKPSQFPAVQIAETSNVVLRGGSDSGSIENYAEVVYQVDIFSNLNKGKKMQCKAIAKLLDAEFSEMGFTRTFINPMQNMNDATIYRITASYRGVVSKDEIIYRR